MATLTALPDRTPVRPVRVAGVEESQATARANIAGQLEEAFQRGWAECARRHGLPLLSAVPSGGAS